MTSRTGKSDAKTRTFSIRLTDAEHKRIREIAARLESSESTVIRYAIRSTLKRIGALSDADSSAVSLVPVFVEHGEELINFFDLDVSSLDRVLNGDTRETCNRIDPADLALLAASGLGEPHVHAKLREIQEHDVEPGDVPTMLRGYFYRKYIYGDSVRTADVISHRGASAEGKSKKKYPRPAWMTVHA